MAVSASRDSISTSSPERGDRENSPAGAPEIKSNLISAFDPESWSTAVTVVREIPGGKLSGTLTVYISCINSGELSFLSNTVIITAVLAEREGLPLSVATTVKL